ncbi:MAG: glycosyltransferase family 2 protein [Pseudomonadota bacterium]
MKISIVTPLYKSAPYIKELHRRCVNTILAIGEVEHEIIFVNDGSPDNSLEIAKAVAADDPCVMVIDLSRNFGQHEAIMTGLGRATGDCIFVMDSDLEDEPEWIAVFYNAFLERDCDVVYGVNNNLKGGWAYSRLRTTFYLVLNYLSTISFPPNVCSARLMSRRYVDALLQFTERELFMAGIWHVAGFTQLPIEVVKHDSSPTTYSTSRLINLFINAVTAFSTRPLTIISVAGIFLSLVAFAFMVWLTYLKLAYGITIEGWTSVMVAVLAIGGITLFFNGVVAIYVAKIFIEVKQRPRSIIREIYGELPSKPPTQEGAPRIALPSSSVSKTVAIPHRTEIH